jgi:glycolate oxidase iron-sulfur subunit
MQTLFSLAQLADPEVAESERILRTCVHCGFCTATCPTYVLGGDELDSPRGRIYLIKDMLENDRPPSRELVKHVDRCLSCLGCMTTCPSGVHYMHLVDHARAGIEEAYRRPRLERLLRTALARLLPDDGRLRWALLLARWGRPLADLFAVCGLAPVAAMLRLAPARLPPRPSREARRQQVFAAEGERRGRVALLAGCVGPVVRPSINAAAIRLLTRHGIEVELAPGQACCGALAHHLGRKQEALAAARANIDAWCGVLAAGGFDAILVTASGCGTMVKDYGFLLRGEAAYAAKAARIAALARDVSEYLGGLDLSRASDFRSAGDGLVIAYHAACSLQHGQKIDHQPKELLCKIGFVVKDVPEGHLCCGSAGTYNILQPDIAKRLRDRKVRNIEKVAPDVIAAGNIGCITQIATGTRIPVVHTVELIDWATGGEKPEALRPKEIVPGR